MTKREKVTSPQRREEGSGCRNSSPLWQHAISYTVHWTTHHEVQGPSAGHKNDGWQVRYSSTPPSIVAPGARRLPTITSITLYSTTCPADAPHCFAHVSIHHGVLDLFWTTNHEALIASPSHPQAVR